MYSSSRITSVLTFLININAESSSWGSPKLDIRGQYWCGWMSTLHLNISNDGRNHPLSEDTESHIDITYSTQVYRGSLKVVQRISTPFWWNVKIGIKKNVSDSEGFTNVRQETKAT
ncbi:hypothetical protein JTB14_033291 [Gonioctena quinquepunctata]|nr:hypothetical protein JTB14_033291 [Gonioctena quinquepunctata]